MRKQRHITKTAFLLAIIFGALHSELYAAWRPKLKPAKQTEDNLTAYVARVKGTPLPAPSPGSLWSTASPFADLAGDYRAGRINDVITIRILEQTSSTNNGAVKSARNFSASSGLTGLFGELGAGNSLRNLASPSSSNSLNGQAQASSSSTLQTSLTGAVVAVLPNGLLVIEASRKEAVDNQEQTLTVRGVVRPGDLAADNSVYSTSISNLEILLNGHGVISDGVRPPNAVIRTILKILEF